MVRRNFSLRRLSRLFGTNPQYIRDAMAIREKDPKFLEAIKRGEVTIPQAKKMLNMKFSITVAFDPAIPSDRKLLELLEKAPRGSKAQFVRKIVRAAMVAKEIR